MSAPLCRDPGLAGNADACLHDLVLANARAFPQRFALNDASGRLTFEELESHSAQVARSILSARSRPEELIAILLPASIDLVVAELAIMRAGAAFLPIDPAYPSGRIEFILSEARVTTIVTDQLYLDRIPPAQFRIVNLSNLTSGDSAEISWPVVAPDALAYVIFTSGSSGRPKGAMIEHRNIINLIRNFRTNLHVTDSDRSSVVSSPAFDASIAEIWPYLASGASAHITPPNLKMDLPLLLDWLRQNRITISLLPTALVELAIDMPGLELPDLRILMTGGDQLHKVPATNLPFRFINAYGPTECTVISTWTDVGPDPGGSRPPSIGQTLDGGFIRILDEQFQETAVGIPGEIFIGGAGVGRGYLNNPERSAIRFVPDPRDPGGDTHLYRTGDRACWRGNGDIAFLGRIDRQISLRGFRIEPAEIEAALRQQEGVQDAVVVLQDDAQSPRLVAFLATSQHDRAALETSVRRNLERNLPHYMQPGVYVVLERFPLTVNGKTDIRQLPMPKRSAHLQQAAGSDVEQTVRETWCRLLSTSNCDPKDNFFQLGGDSLQLIKMLGDLEKLLNVRIPAAAFLREPTMANCVQIVRGRGANDLPDCIISITPEGPHDRQFQSRPPFFCVTGAGGGTHWLREMALASKLNRRFYALETLAIPEELRKNFSLPALARHFLSSLRRVQPVGPYRLGGYSLGGLVALEMAHLLLDEGAAVEPLILVDTYAEIADPGKAQRLFSMLHRFAASTPGDALLYLREKVNWLSRSRKPSTEDEPGFAEIHAEKQREIDIAFAYMRDRIPRTRVPLRLIVSRFGSRYAPKASDRGWSRYADAGLEVCEIPGDHYSIVKQPHVQELGRRLHQFIEG
ncbi:MAG TPA: amino acid adenylation domain-containing protein [Bryobacteraceae bacterium]